jgi:hypothetical protein
MSRRNAQPHNQREQLAKERALEAVSLMRRKHLDITEAAKAAETTRATVLKYARSSLGRTGENGRYEANPFDRIKRTMLFLTPAGEIELTFSDSRIATKIAEYANALKKYRREVDYSALAAFKDKSIRVNGVTYGFVTDRDTIRRILLAGVFSAEGLYRITQEK